MQQRLLVAIIILALIPVLVGTTRGSGSDSSDSATTSANSFSARLHCQVIPDPPERNSDDNPTALLAMVRFRCDEPGATSMQFVLTLQKRTDGGDWSDVAAQSFAAAGAETVRTTAESYRTRQVAGPCSPGTYRTYVKGTLKVDGGTITVDRPGPRATDPCRPSIFGGS